jgi:hypothetical protein
VTLAELRGEVRLLGGELLTLADRAEADDFAPWVVEALRRGGRAAMDCLSNERLEEARLVIERRPPEAS